MKTKTIQTQEELEDLVAYYSEQDEFVFDIESVGKDRLVPAHNRVTWMGLATEGRADVIAFGHPHGDLIRPATKFKEAIWDPEVLTPSGSRPKKQWRTIERPPLWTPKPVQLAPSQVFSALQPLFFSDRTKVGHNVKFDLESVTKYFAGETPPPPYGDTMVAAGLLLEETEPKSLKHLTSLFYGIEYDDRGIGKQVEVHGYHDVAKYVYLDAKMCWLMWRDLVPLLDKHGLEQVFTLEMDLLESLVALELAGVPIDTGPMDLLGERLNDEIKEVTKRIWEVAGEPLNLDATLDKRKLVFDILGYVPKEDQKTAKGDPSVAEKVLQQYAHNPTVADLLNYNDLKKTYSTYIGNVDEKTGEYVSGLRQYICADGRIHTSLNAMGAATGRFTSSKPNLQNIPRPLDGSREEAEQSKGALIRSLFIAGDGAQMVVADYGQIEYRVLAHSEFSNDPTLRRAFEEGFDPHAAVMALILNKPIEEVTKEERNIGKTFNFAAIYGAGLGKLAEGLKLPLEYVKDIKKRYDQQFPEVLDWKQRVVHEARRRTPPHVRTLTGRRRILKELVYSDDGLRYGAERKAVNTVIQGTAADIVKMAMVEVHRNKPAHWDMVLSVHDELALIVPEDEAPDAKTSLEKWMLSVNPIDVPLEVDANFGPSWAAAK